MIDGRRILAVVLARGGSKGLPGKNLMAVGGRPMIAWSVKAASESRLVDRAIVSTDDPAIADAARAAGGDVPFLRPVEFARDESSVHEAMVDVLDRIGEVFDYVVALQATSPLRIGADIDGAIEFLPRRRRQFLYLRHSCTEVGLLVLLDQRTRSARTHSGDAMADHSAPRAASCLSAERRRLRRARRLV